MAVTKRKAEMVVTWHERGVDIETTCRMLGVTPQEASEYLFYLYMRCQQGVQQMSFSYPGGLVYNQCYTLPF